GSAPGRIPRLSGAAVPPRRRAISSARIFSRSSATRRMRPRISDLTMKLEPKVKTTAAAEMAASAEMRNSRWVRSSTKFMAARPRSIVELDHAVHDENAQSQHEHAHTQPDMTQGREEERPEIGGRNHADQYADDEGERADNAGGRLGFGGHGLDFLLHLLAVAQHFGQVPQRFA